MKILFLANPNSLHDNKWISFLAKEGKLKCFLLPRISHYTIFQNTLENERILQNSDLELLPPIHDFSIFRFYRTLYEAILIRKIIKKNKIDIIHILYAEPNALWCLFRRFFSVPMIITTRGTDVLKTIPEAFQKKDFWNRIVSFNYKRAFNLADIVTTTSGKQLESIVKFSNRKKEILIVRTGVDAKRVQNDTSHYFPLKDKKSFVLFPRYIKPVYNHEFCLKAIALLPPEIKANYTMVFIGKGAGDLAYQQLLERMMKEQPDIDFEFIEKQSQEAIFELYKRASLVVMTPTSDGSSVSGMEAMLCGVKLILGPLDYDAAIFSAAIQLKQWNTMELAEKIANALSENTKLELSAKTKQLIDRDYNMQRIIEIYKGFMTT